MDRQQLLEKKRQRLLELKLRRSAVSVVDSSVPEPSAEALLPPPKVDFSVQVDPPKPPVSQASTPRIQSPVPQGTHKIHKSVQTDLVSSADSMRGFVEVIPEVVPPLPSSPEPMPKEQVIHQALEKQLLSLGYSEIRMGIKHVSAPASYSRIPFNMSVSIPKFLGRSIACVATTTHHPSLILVAYGKPLQTNDKPLQTNDKALQTNDKALLTNDKARQSKEAVESLSGLAVLFNRSTDSVTPEFFLQCTSAISKVAFDKSDPFRVVAGLENGRVVMWDLTAVAPTQVAVLPTLQTSYISSLTEKSLLNFVHHVSPIIFMKQLSTGSLQDSAIVTICEDGVINVWSPNFFALPKFSSIELSPRQNDMMLITDALLSSHPPLVSQERLHDTPEYRFLDLIVMASANGVIYRLTNQKENNHVGSEWKDHINGAVHSSAVTSLVELPNSLVLSAHSDFFLRVWHSALNKLLTAIPTTTLISTLLGRPGHPSQVVTLGTLRIPDLGLCVELWDFDVDIKGPVFNIPTRKETSSVASFSENGNELVLGYDDGEVDIWKIDDSILLNYIASLYPEAEGIESLASTHYTYS